MADGNGDTTKLERLKERAKGGVEVSKSGVQRVTRRAAKTGREYADEVARADMQQAARDIRRELRTKADTPAERASEQARMAAPVNATFEPVSHPQRVDQWASAGLESFSLGAGGARDQPALATGGPRQQRRRPDDGLLDFNMTADSLATFGGTSERDRDGDAMLGLAFSPDDPGSGFEYGLDFEAGDSGKKSKNPDSWLYWGDDDEY